MSDQTSKNIGGNSITPSFISGVLALIVLLCLGLATLIDMLDGPQDPREEVTAARTPDLPVTWDAFKAFPASARHYLKRRWILKNEILQLDSWIKLKAFNHLPGSEVMVGRDGFIFLEDDVAIGGYTGLPQFSEQDILVWQGYMQTIKRETDSRSIDFHFILGPSKHSAYPDKLPTWMTGLQREQRRHEVILEIGADYLAIPPVDLYDFFESYRRDNPDQQLYFTTDSHWNEHGASLATHAALSLQLPSLPPPQYTNSNTQNGGDLARMIGLSENLTETLPIYPRDGTFSCRTADVAPLDLQTIDPPIIEIVHCISKVGIDQKVLAVMDSFGVGAEPYIARNFRESVFIRTDEVDFSIVDEIQPDILVQFFAERKSLIYKPETAIILPSGE